MNTPLTRIAPGTQTKSLTEPRKRFQSYSKGKELEGRRENLRPLKRALSVRAERSRGSVIHSFLKRNLDKGLSGFSDNHLSAQHSTLGPQYCDADRATWCQPASLHPPLRTGASVEEGRGSAIRLLD